MLLVRAWSPSSAWSRPVGGGSVDQRLPTSRISPDAASWRSRRSVFGCCSPATLAILPVVYSPLGSSRSAFLTHPGGPERCVRGAAGIESTAGLPRFAWLAGRTGRAGHSLANGLDTRRTSSPVRASLGPVQRRTRASGARCGKRRSGAGHGRSRQVSQYPNASLFLTIEDPPPTKVRRLPLGS